MTSINDPRKGYNAETGKVEEFSLRRRPETSNADEWALWLQEHAEYGIEYKAVQIAEALDSLHRGVTNYYTRGSGSPRPLLDALRGLVGLIDLVLARDDLPTELRHVLQFNHRVDTARGVVAKADDVLRKRPIAWMRYVQGGARFQHASDKGDPPEEEGWIALYRRGGQ